MFWVGLTLLCLIVAPLWLGFISSWLAEPDIANIIFGMIFLTLLTAVPVGIMVYGVYSARLRRKAPPVEVKLGLEPSYPSLRRRRDKRIDKLCADLCIIGLEARVIELRSLTFKERLLVERRQLLEEVGKPFDAELVGLIEVRNSPVRLINVLKSQGNVYLVPDSRLFRQDYETSVQRSGRSVRVKSVSVFGQGVGLRWKGNLEGDLMSRLAQDVLLNQTLVRLNEDIHIRSYPEHGCWRILSSPGKPQYQPTTPSREQWDCYESIARHLLQSSGK